jgi:hypothetical protein
MFDDSGDPADYAPTARWRDGQVRKRNVCLNHLVRGVRSLQEFRESDAGEPTISRLPCGARPLEAGPELIDENELRSKRRSWVTPTPVVAPHFSTEGGHGKPSPESGVADCASWASAVAIKG